MVRENLDGVVDSALIKASKGEPSQAMIVTTSDAGSTGNQRDKRLNSEKNKESRMLDGEAAVGRDSMAESNKAKQTERSPVIGSDDHTDRGLTKNNVVEQSMQEPEVKLRSVSTNSKHEEEV